MGTLRLTDNQWTAVQANAERPRVQRIFQRVNLGIPAPVDVNGTAVDVAVATHWLFDDPRLPGDWRVRVAAGPTIFFQEWAEGVQQRELTLAQMNTLFGLS